MCGIIYYKSFTGRPVNRKILRHYQKQKHRGQEGFGFVGISGRRIVTCRATEEKGIRHYLKRHPFSEILFHHRIPTSTTNTIRTTHPILVSQPVYSHRYYVIHNGMIMNADEMRLKHEQMGITYTTSQFSQCRTYWGEAEIRHEFNDSEALAHELALFLDGKQGGIAAKGDIAFICLETDRSNNALKLHFARNSGAPLEMKRDSACLVIASESVSNQDIPPNALYTYDYRSQEITRRDIKLPEQELFGYFSFVPIDSYRDHLDEMEMRIYDYEEKLRQIEDAQFRASARGDTVRYQRLQVKREQLEERIQQLWEEWCYLERICFE